MKIKGFEKLSCVDYPYHISCVIFLGGCNMRCGYCYNKKLVTNLNEVSDINPTYIFEYIKKRKKMLDGICVTGGEPTVNPDLPIFLEKLKSFGLPVKLDTNGTHPEMIDYLIKKKLVDYVALDVKAPLNLSYSSLTGIKENDTDYIRKTLSILVRSGIEFELRTTVIPTVHTDFSFEIMKCHVLQMLGSDFDPSKINWYLQHFIPKDCLDDSFNSLPATTDSDLHELATKLRGTFPNVFVR